MFWASLNNDMNDRRTAQAPNRPARAGDELSILFQGSETEVAHLENYPRKHPWQPSK
jgi:hypothetical protein